MCNLTNLQVLQLKLEAVPGFDSLISLREVVADVGGVSNRPNLQNLTKLQRLEIRGWGLGGQRGLNYLAMLPSLNVHYYRDVTDKLPLFRSMMHLQTLIIRECCFKDVSGLSNLSTLERLEIIRC